MKIKHNLLTVAFLSAFSLQPSALHAQGSLTPPGAPGATMKSLAQIEPRTPISSAPFTITNSGSYYVTTNLTVSSGNAIVIATNGVTLDLNGFTLKSTEAANNGIAIYLNGGLRNLTILNGFIEGGVTNNGSGVYSGPGFGYGIYSLGVDPANTRVSGITVTGCKYDAIYVSYGSSTVVENCTVRTVGGVGIKGDVIKSCSATDCGANAIEGGQVSDSHGESTGSYTGIDGENTANCYGYSSSGDGLSTDTAQNCNGYSSSGDGLDTDTAQNCNGYSNTGTGLVASTAQNCYGYSGSGTGLDADGTAQNCFGYSGSGTGLSATVANNCTGYRYGGTAIHATVANGCYATSGTNFITYKYNMP